MVINIMKSSRLRLGVKLWEVEAGVEVEVEVEGGGAGGGGGGGGKGRSGRSIDNVEIRDTVSFWNESHSFLTSTTPTITYSVRAQNLGISIPTGTTQYTSWNQSGITYTRGALDSTSNPNSWTTSYKYNIIIPNYRISLPGGNGGPGQAGGKGGAGGSGSDGKKGAYYDGEQEVISDSAGLQVDGSTVSFDPVSNSGGDGTVGAGIVYNCDGGDGGAGGPGGKGGKGGNSGAGGQGSAFGTETTASDVESSLRATAGQGGAPGAPGAPGVSGDNGYNNSCNVLYGDYATSGGTGGGVTEGKDGADGGLGGLAGKRREIDVNYVTNIDIITLP